MTISNQQDDLPLTTEQAAQLIGCAPGTLANARSAGRDGPPFYRVGRSVRYLRSAVLSYREQLLTRTVGAA